MQEGILYRRILREALNLTWKHKALWLLGFLAVFWGDVGAYRALNRTLGKVDFFSDVVPWRETVLQAGAVFSTGAFVASILLTLLVLAFLVAFLMLVTAGRGGLIAAVAEKAVRRGPQILPSLRKGLHAFWPLLGIGILSRLDVPLYLMLFGNLGEVESSPALFILYVGAFIVLVLLSIVLSLLGMYASSAVMLRGVSMRRAIAESFRLFEKYWLVSVEMGLLLYLITFLVGLVVVFVLFVLGLPFFFLGVLAGLLKASFGVWAAIGGAATVYVVFLLLVGSAFMTFQYAAWVLLYLRLEKEGAQAKLVRLTSRFAHIFHRKIV